MDPQTDILAELEAEIQEKRKTANSSHRKYHKGGKTILPYEYLKGKERKAYMAPSDVKTTNLLEQVGAERFRRLDSEEQKRRIEACAEAYGYNAAAISEGLGIHRITVTKYIGLLGIKGWLTNRNAKSTKEERRRQRKKREMLHPAPAPEEKPTPTAQADENSRGLVINLDMEGPGKEIAAKLFGVASCCSTDDRKYSVKLSIVGGIEYDNHQRDTARGIYSDVRQTGGPPCPDFRHPGKSPNDGLRNYRGIAGPGRYPIL